MNEHYYISEDMTMDDMVKALDALESVAYNLLRKQENTYNSMENTLFKAVNQAWKTAEAIAMVQDSSTASATK
jgi:arsenate reductase-like glutaredoxin family protein